MFNNYHKLGKQSLIRQNRCLSLPLQSYKKSNYKYQTPYKLSSSTNVTRNNTLSFNSLVTKNKSTIVSKNTANKKQKLLFFQQGGPKSKYSKNDRYLIAEKKSRKSSKSMKKAAKLQKVKEEVNLQSKVVTNTQFYRSSRGKSPGTDITFQYMSKISKIFDLVNQSQKIPLQIEVFLNLPITKLRQRLKKYKKREIAQSLIRFKNDCMDIFRKSSNKEITLFLRLTLPQSNRWQVNNQRYNQTKQENDRESRERYFRSLRMKDFQYKPQDLYQLKKIQTRLDEFLERSFKNRKVYI